MATKLISLTNLTTYDTLIKSYIDTADAKSIKTVLWDATNEQLNFYKKENATASDTPDYQVTISSSDVAALQARVGMTSTLNAYQSQTNITDITNVLTGDNTTTGSVAKAQKDAQDYADGLVEGLDVTEFALAEKNSSTDVVTIHGISEADGVIAVGANSANDVVLAAVAATGNAEDVAYDNTDSGLTATDVQSAVDEVVAGLGTAAAADIATSPIAESSDDPNLVSAAQVATFVASEIAGLEGAMHFRGVITRQTGETDAQAIARAITDPEAGDVVVMSDNAKEYIYSDSSIGWREVGDEGEFVKKTTTIAGVDLQDNITKAELLTALNVADGAQVNIIESVKVNGSALTPDSNKAVDVTVVEGATNGTIAVNGTDVAVHGLGTAAYQADTYFMKTSDYAATTEAEVYALFGLTPPVNP